METINSLWLDFGRPELRLTNDEKTRLRARLIGLLKYSRMDAEETNYARLVLDNLGGLVGHW